MQAVRPAPGGFASRLEGWLRVAVEVPTALLVLVEICVLLAGVVSRFVLNHPFTWSDELASILFLWLAFGSLDLLEGQVLGKLWMVLLSLPFIHWIRKRELSS